MDFDGLMLLMEKDSTRFDEWKKKSEDFSLEELRESCNEWMAHYRETYEKYKGLESEDKIKDATLLCAKLLYFYFLTNYTLNALVAYTTELKKEYNSLKKSGKGKQLSRKNIKRKKS